MSINSVGHSVADAAIRAAVVCPKAPGDAQKYVNDITGYVQWGVLVLLVIGIIVGIGAIVAGRVFSMPQASQTGIVSIVVVFLSAIGYMILPGMINGVTGSGCV